jgi:hypothetical protein
MNKDEWDIKTIYLEIVFICVYLWLDTLSA